jgi:hypothetical protein
MAHAPLEHALCTSLNQILTITFITLKSGELKQKVIVGEGDPTIFILENT